MTRHDPPGTGGERETLDGFLDFHRATLELKCAGLDAEQLATRSQPPSSLSLLGLVRHMAEVEGGWFARVDGTQWRPRYYSDDDPEGEFDNAAPDDALVAEAFEYWRSSIATSQEIAARHSLDDTFVHRSGETLSLRWVLVHLVEEYARHNGHADLLREAIDGAVGE